jgi:sugar (pentulose or hexulose) kinase
MSTFKNLAGVLAVGTALTGGAVALGGAVTSTSASATTVMGGYVGGERPAARHYVRYHRPAAAERHVNKNKNKNKNKQNQQHRQHQNQRQFLMRDFTLVLTPFQKSETAAAAVPWNHQYQDSQTMPYNYQWESTNTKTDPHQDTHTDVDPRQDTETDLKSKEKQDTEVKPRQKQEVEEEEYIYPVISASPFPG